MSTMKDERTKEQIYEKHLEQVRGIVEGGGTKEMKLKTICELLYNEINYYDWVGFYLAHESKRILNLGPYVGESTIHTMIPFGEGICGQAAEKERTIIVQDVSRETNYLSCAPNVKSEIVVPIFKEGRIAGELDIDSHIISPFTWEDRKFLESICGLIEPLM